MVLAIRFAALEAKLLHPLIRPRRGEPYDRREGGAATGIFSWKRRLSQFSSVLDQKFASSGLSDRRIVEAESFDGSEDLVRGLCPSEGFGIDVVLVDESGDVGLEFGHVTMDAAAYFLVGK